MVPAAKRSCAIFSANLHVQALIFREGWSLRVCVFKGSFSTVPFVQLLLAGNVVFNFSSIQLREGFIHTIPSLATACHSYEHAPASRLDDSALNDTERTHINGQF